MANYINEKYRLIFEISSIVFCLLGIAFFFGFYFGMVTPAKDKIDRSESGSCIIDNIIENPRRCSKIYGCKCVGCGSDPICALREQTINSTGECCGSSCCAHYETSHYPCRKYRCTWSCPNDKTCCSRWTTCTNRYCADYSTERCITGWDNCWDPILLYYLTKEFEIGKERQQEFHCGYGERDCVDDIYKNYPINTSVPCWLDTKTDKVSFSSPNKARLKGGWVGTGFGIAFLCLGFFSCVAVFCIVCKLCRKTTDDEKPIDVPTQRSDYSHYLR